MKRSTKTLLRFMVFFLVIGGALCIAGLAMGFRPATLYAMEESGEIQWVGPSGFRKMVKRAVTGGSGSGAQSDAGSGSGNGVQSDVGIIGNGTGGQSDTGSGSGAGGQSDMGSGGNGNGIRAGADGNGAGVQAGAGAGGNGVGVQAGAGAGGNGAGVQAGAGAGGNGAGVQAGAGIDGNGTGVQSDGAAEFEQSFSGVAELELDCGVTDCVLIPWEGEEWKVLGGNLPSGFQVQQKQDTLKVKCSQKHLFGVWNDPDDAYLKIYIPQDQTVEELDLCLGVGSLTMEEGILRCRSLDLECGVGSCSLRLDIQKEAELDCGVGDVSLEILGEEEDFDYDLDLGLGDVVIGDSSYGGIADDREIHNGASKEISMDCGVGSVTLSFVEEKE